jgi:hypothetical protein
MITYLKAGTVKRIHVNRQVLARNLKEGRNDPACTVQTSKGPHACKAATILGHSEMRQAGTFRRDTGGMYTVKPLGCGARVWVETRAAVEVIT